MLAELISTPYDIIVPDSILFLEDVAEPIYKIERIFYQLRLSGVLGRLRGLIVGQFTEYRPDRNYTDMESMIRGCHRRLQLSHRFRCAHRTCRPQPAGDRIGGSNPQGKPLRHQFADFPPQLTTMSHAWHIAVLLLTACLFTGCSPSDEPAPGLDRR